MIHKCDYAILIGQTPAWIKDDTSFREVCMFCHEPKESPKPAAKEPLAAKTVRKTA